MSTNTKRFSVPFVLYLVVLLGLVYMFHTELFVTGIRLYVTAVHNPRAEQLLGDYYQNNAQLSDELSRAFYANSMKKYKEELPTASSGQQAAIKLRIGQLYLCGKGVTPNASEAKRWLDEAMTLATGSGDKSDKSQDMLISEIKQSLAFVNEGNRKGLGKNSFIQPCHLQSESEFFNLIP